MRQIDQEKRAIVADERQKLAVGHIRQIAAAVEMWDGMPVERREELTALILDSMLEVVREHVPKCEHPTPGFKV